MSGYSGSVSMTGTASAGGAEFNVQLSLTLSVSSLTDNSGQLTGNETVSGNFISTSTEGGSDSGDTSLVNNPLSITGPYPDGPFTYLEHFPAALNQGDSQLPLPGRIWRN